MRRRGIRLVRICLAALVLSVAAGAVGADSNAPPVFRNIRAQYVEFSAGRVPPSTPFFTEQRQAVYLKNFRGKVVLLNFWATWCLPCRIEMPSLDRLQVEMGGKDFTIVAISIDREGLSKVRPYYAKLGLKNLKIYLDPDQRTGYLKSSGKTGGAFPLYSFPISYIIDQKGRVAGYFPGPAKWDSPGTKRLINYYIKHPPK